MTTTAPRRLFVCAALAAASCAGGAPPRPAWARIAEPTHVTTTVVIPTSWDDGSPIVEAWIDGHGPFRFVLDSGASGLVIDRRIADELKLELADLPNEGPQGQTFDAGEGKFTVRRTAHIHEFRAGPLTNRDGAALVVDLSLLGRIGGARVDGILPARMFRGGLLTFDHGRGDVTFASGELPTADGKEVLAIQSDDVCYVTIETCRRPCPVLIDTGNAGFIHLPAALESSLRFHAPPTIVGRYATLAGITPRRAGRIDGTLMWGDCRVADPLVDLSAATYGNVGMEFLREFRVTFDFTNRRVRFERAAGDPVRSRPVRSPGAGFLHDEGPWTVGYVLDGGPAERADLRVGDRVEAIDGRPVGEIGYVEWDKMLATRESVTLRVVRDGAAREVVVEIATLVE